MNGGGGNGGVTERFVRIDCDGEQCLGILATPGEGRSTTGVVIVVGGPQTRVGSHRQFVTLARALAAARYPTLRFDYFGTGDSSGELTSATALDWKADIFAAAQELKDAAGVRRISIVGFRLGAALAASAVADGLEVKDLVFWEPAVNGRTHLRELRALDAARLAESRTPPRWTPGVDELLGDPLLVVLEKLAMRHGRRRL